MIHSRYLLPLVCLSNAFKDKNATKCDFNHTLKNYGMIE